MRVTWSGAGTDRRPKRVYVPEWVREQTQEGMSVIGSSLHNIAVSVRPRVRRSRPGQDVPSLLHEVVLTDELREQLEALVINPTLRAEVGTVLVIATGPTGCGKTTAMHWCANEIQDRCDRLAFWDFPSGYFRRSYWGESEAVTRELFATAMELAEEGYHIFVSVEDCEATVLQSRQWSQHHTSGCGSTAAATTSEWLHGLKMLADAAIPATVWTSSNYSSQHFDPAITAGHRLRAIVPFEPLRLSMVPTVVAAHAATHEVAEGVVDWVVEAYSRRTVLCRGRRENAAIEVVLEDCLTPAMIAATFGRAWLFAQPDAIETGHVIRAFSGQMSELAGRIAGQAGPGGDVGMIVPALAGARNIELTPAFDPAEINDGVRLEEVLVRA